MVGVVNLLCLWPFFFVLHASGIETFELPTGQTLGALLLNALIGTALSDVLWALSVVLTNPVVATVGLSLTIPVAMLADLMLGNAQFRVLYLLGMGLVFGGFLLVNWAYRDPAAAPAPAQEKQDSGSTPLVATEQGSVQEP